MIEQSVSLASNGVVKVPGYEQLVRFGYTKNRGVYRLHVDATGEWEGLTIRCFWHVPDGKDPASSLVADGYVAVPASVTAQPGSGCVTFEGSDSTKTMISADLRYRVSANSGTEDGTEPEPGTPAWQQLVDAVHTDATAAEQAKTDAQTAAQQAGASAKKAGQALSDTITAKEDALKAIGDKQAAATKVVDTARDEALQQVEASTEAAQTAASEAATSAGSASQSAQEAAGSLQELKDEIASGDFKGEPGTSPTVTVQDIAGGHRIVITDATGTSSVDVMDGKQGDPGKDATVDTTLTHEGEAADAKAAGDAISAVKVRQNILIGTETGNPLSVDDAFSAPLCGLTVYGRSTQDGTPSPDNPVPIVSAGDGGSVAVKVTGANILYLPDIEESTVGGITYSVKNGVIKIKGTSTGKNVRLLRNIKLFVGTGVFNPNPVKGTESSNCYLDLTNTINLGFSIRSNNINKPVKITELNVKHPFYLDIASTAGSVIDMEWKPQMLLSDKLLSYSPYHEQLLTLPTPNGLPGIPVTSGGNYTDQNGQQWICDEVDLERGVKVQRVYKIDVDGENSKFEQNGNYANLSTRGIPIASYVGGQQIYAISTFTSLPWYYNTKNGQFLYLIAADISGQINESCKKQLGKVYYALATPIETPLAPAEIAAYKAITAYAPDTVVQASDDAGIKLGYQRDVNLVVKNLEDAIASMTTT